MSISSDRQDTPAGGSSWAGELSQLLGEAERRLRRATDSGDRQLDTLRLRLEQQVRRMQLQLDDIEHTVAYRVRHGLRAADMAAHEHPYRGIGLAALLGVCLGALLARR